jgi:radical SAM/Cys-rich protein
MVSNEFEKQIGQITGGGLHSRQIEILQINLGLQCNQQCLHCHLNASPHRTEMMEWPVMELALHAAGNSGCRLVDLTGGAPELNPNFCRFIEALRKNGHEVQVRTNLTVLLEPGMDKIPEFFREHNIRLVASLPCYLEENVSAQRGKGAYEKSIAAIRQLNTLGYGLDPKLPLNLVYNPGGPFLPPLQSALEEDYRRQLGERFGIGFTQLLTITNMPLGRFRTHLSHLGQERNYLTLLRKSFNPDTLSSLMCRYQISIGWDGTLYDCDFNLALGLPVNHGAPDHIKSFRLADLNLRRIVTGEHCYGCTAGGGSSCQGALV